MNCQNEAVWQLGSVHKIHIVLEPKLLKINFVDAGDVLIGDSHGNRSVGVYIWARLPPPSTTPVSRCTLYISIFWLIIIIHLPPPSLLARQSTSIIKAIYLSKYLFIYLSIHPSFRFHVAVFGGDGPLLAEFECPHVKVWSGSIYLSISDLFKPYYYLYIFL